MVSLIIIGIILVIILILIKLNDLKYRILLIILFILAIIFYTSFSASGNVGEFTSIKGLFNTVAISWEWITQIPSNLKTLTGNFLKADWTEKNNSTS
jgi:hypothetical protein